MVDVDLQLSVAILVQLCEWTHGQFVVCIAIQHRRLAGTYQCDVPVVELLWVTEFADVVSGIFVLGPQIAGSDPFAPVSPGVPEHRCPLHQHKVVGRYASRRVQFPQRLEDVLVAGAGLSQVGYRVFTGQQVRPGVCGVTGETATHTPDVGIAVEVH